MSEFETIARPYAKAAYEQAKETQSTAQWQVFLDIAAAFFKQKTDINKFLLDSAFTKKLGEWVNELVEKARGQGLTQAELNFLKVLADFDRLSVLPEIAEKFHETANRVANTSDVTIYTARPLSESAVSNLKAKLEAKINKTVSLNIIEKADLQAGISIEYDGLVIDQSMKGKIEAFSHQLEEMR